MKIWSSVSKMRLIVLIRLRALERFPNVGLSAPDGRGGGAVSGMGVMARSVEVCAQGQSAEQSAHYVRR